MTWLKVFVVIAFIVINWCVLSFEPAVHSPFVMEKKDFKLAKHYQVPISSDTINLFKIGIAKLPPAEISREQLISSENTQNITREVHIEPSEFYRQANGIGMKDVSNSQIKNSSLNSRTNSPSIVEQPSNEVSKIKEKPRKLTRKEENIVWNNWHSALQNRIMNESQVSAPLGTLITFSFRVSNKKTVSNIRVNSTNWSYTKSIREVMIPLIKSYAGKDFLAFPEGSERKFIDFKGAYLIWYETSYSTPDDYNDFERVHWYE